MSFWLLQSKADDALAEQFGNILDAMNKGAPGDHLWEDNWDDDDIEDDFTKQLRSVLPLSLQVFSSKRFHGPCWRLTEASRQAINERSGAADEAMKD